MQAEINTWPKIFQHQRDLMLALLKTAILPGQSSPNGLIYQRFHNSMVGSYKAFSDSQEQYASILVTPKGISSYEGLGSYRLYDNPQLSEKPGVDYDLNGQLQGIRLNTQAGYVKVKMVGDDWMVQIPTTSDKQFTHKAFNRGLSRTFENGSKTIAVQALEGISITTDNDTKPLKYPLNLNVFDFLLPFLTQLRTKN